MASFKPPPVSLGQCEGVPFDTAIDTAAENKAVFDAFDKTLTQQSPTLAANEFTYTVCRLYRR